MKDGRVAFEPAKGGTNQGEFSVTFNTMIADAPQYKALQEQLNGGMELSRQDGNIVIEQRFKNALLCLEPETSAATGSSEQQEADRVQRAETLGLKRASMPLDFHRSSTDVAAGIKTAVDESYSDRFGYDNSSPSRKLKVKFN